MHSSQRRLYRPLTPSISRNWTLPPKTVSRKIIQTWIMTHSRKSNWFKSLSVLLPHNEALISPRIYSFSTLLHPPFIGRFRGYLLIAAFSVQLFYKSSLRKSVNDLWVISRETSTHKKSIWPLNKECRCSKQVVSLFYLKGRHIPVGVPWLPWSTQQPDISIKIDRHNHGVDDVSTPHKNRSVWWSSLCLTRRGCSRYFFYFCKQSSVNTRVLTFNIRRQLKYVWGEHQGDNINLF